MRIWIDKNGIDVTQPSPNKNTSSTITGITNSKDIINKVYDLYDGKYVCR